VRAIRAFLCAKPLRIGNARRSGANFARFPSGKLRSGYAAPFNGAASTAAGA